MSSLFLPIELIDARIQKCSKTVCGTKVHRELAASNILYDVDNGKNVRVRSGSAIVRPVPGKVKEPFHLLGWPRNFGTFVGQTGPALKNGH